MKSRPCEAEETAVVFGCVQLRNEKLVLWTQLSDQMPREEPGGRRPERCNTGRGLMKGVGRVNAKRDRCSNFQHENLTKNPRISQLREESAGD